MKSLCLWGVLFFATPAAFAEDLSGVVVVFQAKEPSADCSPAIETLRNMGMSRNLEPIGSSRSATTLCTGRVSFYGTRWEVAAAREDFEEFSRDFFTRVEDLQKLEISGAFSAPNLGGQHESQKFGSVAAYVAHNDALRNFNNSGPSGMINFFNHYGHPEFAQAIGTYFESNQCLNNFEFSSQLTARVRGEVLKLRKSHLYFTSPICRTSRH